MFKKNVVRENHVLSTFQGCSSLDQYTSEINTLFLRLLAGYKVDGRRNFENMKVSRRVLLHSSANDLLYSKYLKDTGVPSVPGPVAYEKQNDGSSMQKLKFNALYSKTKSLRVHFPAGHGGS